MANIDEEEPLDPVLENVRRKLMRVMMISIGILMLGLLGLLFAIVYKLSQTDDTITEATNTPSAVGSFKEQIELGLGDNLQIISSELDHNRLKLHIERTGGTEEILIIDLGSGNILSSVKLD